jgi:hypothetical protein
MFESYALYELYCRVSNCCSHALAAGGRMSRLDRADKIKRCPTQIAIAASKSNGLSAQITSIKEEEASWLAGATNAPDAQHMERDARKESLYSLMNSVIN